MEHKEAQPDYLAALNEEQREAVFHEGRPLLILAGAGSGKTRVITAKIAYLIREREAAPWSILAVTFTNKAAAEMRERARAIDERAGEAMVRTFHSFGAWFLRKNSSLAGLDSNFVIYDDDDSVTLLQTLLPNQPKNVVKDLCTQIARAKDYFRTPEDYISGSGGPPFHSSKDIDDAQKFGEIYALYEQRLRQTGNVDFGDLIKKPVEILRDNPDVQDHIRRRFRVIMVDEYQDANIAQFELLKVLFGDKNRGEPPYICVVGDDDQSIYRFRGAEVRNILEFPARFSTDGGEGGVDIIRLERNYRSTQPILSLAHRVVDNNKGRLGKRLIAVREGGSSPVAAYVADQDAEARYCASIIRKAKLVGGCYSDWAVLYRTNAQSRSFENILLRQRIPYRIVGTVKFYEREEIKDSLALLAFLLNPRDEVAFRRVVNKPARAVGKAAVGRIIDFASRENCPLDAAALETAKTLPKKAQTGLNDFLAVISAGAASLSEKDNSQSVFSGERLRAYQGLAVCVATLLELSGIAAFHEKNDEIQGEQRLVNLQELVNGAVRYECTREGLAEFLESIELDRAMMAERDNGSEDAVTLITVHNTKGLEWNSVIITGLEQGLFPREDKTGSDLEEERRLFYVGATRAKDNLYLTSAAIRSVYGKIRPMTPSVFLSEAGGAGVKVIGSSELHSAELHSAKLHSAKLYFDAAQKPQESADHKWRLGDGIFSDDHGSGEVIGITSGGDIGDIIKAQFHTGKVIKFLSTQSKNFLRIRDSE